MKIKLFLAAVTFLALRYLFAGELILGGLFSAIAFITVLFDIAYQDALK
jgi:hypothetical protein